MASMRIVISKMSGLFACVIMGILRLKVIWSSRHLVKRASATRKTVGVKKIVTRFLIGDSEHCDEVQKLGSNRR